MRFYLIDRITNIEIGKSIEGIKCWTITDEVFIDHFPGFPVVPGVLLTESMSQLLGFLIEKSSLQKYPDLQGVYVILSMIHKAKFKDFVIPGDRCEITAEITSLDSNRGSGKTKTYVDKKLLAEAELSFFIISKENVPENRFLERREEYHHIITSKWLREK